MGVVPGSSSAQPANAENSRRYRSIAGMGLRSLGSLQAADAGVNDSLRNEAPVPAVKFLVRGFSAPLPKRRIDL